MKTIILLTLFTACACAPVHPVPELIDIVLPDGTVMLVPIESAHTVIRQEFKP